MHAEAKRILEEGCHLLGIRLTARQMHQFDLYLARLKKWNQRINLTAIKTDKDIVIKHFLDSLTLAGLVKPGVCLIDIGTGAGFPGLPLKIIQPFLKLTLVESKRKKVAFLKEIRRLLDLKDVLILNSYLTDNSHPELFESFDLATSRALAKPRDFLKLVLPYVKPDGLIVIMQGPKEDDIYNLSKEFGVKVQEEKEFSLPFDHGRRKIIALKKTAL